MKVVLVVLFLAGIILSADAACSASACTLGLATTCQQYNTYLTCLNGQMKMCGPNDDASKTGIKAAIDAANVAKGLLGCGAAGLTVPIVSILLPVLIALFKS